LSVVTVVPVNRSSNDSAKNNQWAQHAWFRRCGWLRRKHRSVSSKQTIYQIRVNGQAAIEVPALAEAEAIAQRLRRALQNRQFDPSTLEPTIINGLPSGRADQDLLFSVSQALAQALNQNAELIAIAWINNLRLALDAESLSFVESQTRLYNLAQTGEMVEGIASWYGPRFHGRPTATGEIFDQDGLTAAHSSLPFNTFLKVTNLKTGVSVIVRINDRGPYIGKRSLDLSHAAARCVDSETAGVIPYRAVILRSHLTQTIAKDERETEAQPLTISDHELVR
jgi:rare lipoprotein A